jgi:RimJ/RimL family protein N-acetyltransferase
VAAGRAADVRLRDGGWIKVRPIEPSDADGIVNLHARLSDRTRYYRFFSAYPRIPSADVKRFVTVDHHDREALVAVLGNDLVGVTRYERLANGVDAEVAFVVADAHHRRGIATVLLQHLVVAARAAGVTRFMAEVLPENTPMMRVFASTGFEIHSAYAHGVIHVSFSITPDTATGE